MKMQNSRAQDLQPVLNGPLNVGHPHSFLNYDHEILYRQRSVQVDNHECNSEAVPRAVVKYSFINRGRTPFPDGFADDLRKEVDTFGSITLSPDEEKFLISRCYFFDPVFIDLLKGYRYDPAEVTIAQHGSNLSVEIEGLWYRTVLWEVPLLALISELFFLMKGVKPSGIESRAAESPETE